MPVCSWCSGNDVNSETMSETHLDRLQRQLNEIQTEIDEMLGENHPTKLCPECKGERTAEKDGEVIACPTCIGRGKV